MAIFISFLAVLFIIYSLYDVRKNSNIGKKMKVNWSFIIVILPLLGSVIYFLNKINEEEKLKKQKNRN